MATSKLLKSEIKAATMHLGFNLVLFQLFRSISRWLHTVKKYPDHWLKNPSKITSLFFIPYYNCWRPSLFSFDTPHCNILKKAWGTLLSCFTICEPSCEGRFHFFSSPIKNTIQGFLLSFHTQNEAQTKMLPLDFFFRMNSTWRTLKLFTFSVWPTVTPLFLEWDSVNELIYWIYSLLYHAIKTTQDFLHVHMKPSLFASKF